MWPLSKMLLTAACTGKVRFGGERRVLCGAWKPTVRWLAVASRNLAPLWPLHGPALTPGAFRLGILRFVRRAWLSRTVAAGVCSVQCSSASRPRQQSRFCMLAPNPRALGAPLGSEPECTRHRGPASSAHSCARRSALYGMSKRARWSFGPAMPASLGDDAEGPLRALPCVAWSLVCVCL